MMVRRLILGVLAAAAGFLAIFFWLSRHSFVREVIDTERTWTQKALADDTLVLQKWLIRRGWKAQRGGGHVRAQDLPPGGLVMILRLPAPLSDPEVDTLLAWVKQGGHLMVDASAAPFEDGRGTQALLARVGAHLQELPEPMRPKEQVSTDSFQDEGIKLNIRRSQSWVIKVDRTQWQAWMGSDQGERLVQRREGQGILTLVSDLSFVYNFQFGELDHAAWMGRYIPTTHAGLGAVVWSRPVEQNLLLWLWQRAWPFLIACGVLLLVWFWGGLWRFGARLAEPEEARRSILEHLEASGRFFWHHGATEALLARCRASVLKLAQRRHPAFLVLPEAERWAFLKDRTGLSESDLAEALDDRPWAESATSARRLHLLMLIRHRLSH